MSDREQFLSTHSLKLQSTNIPLKLDITQNRALRIITDALESTSVVVIEAQNGIERLQFCRTGFLGMIETNANQKMGRMSAGILSP